MSTPYPSSALDLPAAMVRDDATGAMVRPQSVTSAVALLIVGAGLELVDLGLSFAVRNTRLSEPALPDAIATQLSEGPTSLTPVGVGLSLSVVTIGLVLAALLLRRVRAARIGGLMFSGLSLICFLAAGSVSPPILITRTEPHWYLEYIGTANAVAFGVTTAVLVLLARRPAREYCDHP